MKRSDLQFPLADNSCLDSLRMIWEHGWLDDFSENHFLIQAINGRFHNFRTMDQMNDATPNLYNDCRNCLNFTINFSQQIKRFIDLCDVSKAEQFIKDQLSAGKNNYSEDQFFEAMHEIHVFSYLTSFGKPNVDYEPAIGGLSGKKNPEYRIRNRFAMPGKAPGMPLVSAEDYTFDVEVKSIVGQVNTKIDLRKPFITPIVAIEYDMRNQLYAFCNERGFQVELPDVVQLTSFLNDAADKFDIPTYDNHFNLLYINWTYREIPALNYLEPLSLLDNPMNGLLRHRDIGLKFGISEDVFEKISAIFIYSYPNQAFVFHDIKWVFANKYCAVLFNPKLTEKQKLQLTHIFHMAPSANPITPLILPSPPVTTMIEAMAFSNLEGVEKVIKKIMFK